MPKAKKRIIAEADVYRIRMYRGWTRSQTGIAAIDSSYHFIALFGNSFELECDGLLRSVAPKLYPNTIQVNLHFNGIENVLWHLADGYWGRKPHVIFDGVLRKLYARERRILETEIGKFSKDGLLYKLVK